MATIRSYIHNMSVELRLKPLETALYIGFSGQGITPLKIESCVYFCICVCRGMCLSVRMKCVFSFTH